MTSYRTHFITSSFFGTDTQTRSDFHVMCFDTFLRSWNRFWSEYSEVFSSQDSRVEVHLFDNKF